MTEVVDEHPGGVAHPAHDQGTGQVAGAVAEDPGDVAHLAYHKEAGRVSGVVEEHPGGAVHPDPDPWWCSRPEGRGG